jgi:hypothetical protein
METGSLGAGAEIEAGCEGAKSIYIRIKLSYSEDALIADPHRWWNETVADGRDSKAIGRDSSQHQWVDQRSRVSHDAKGDRLNVNGDYSQKT